MSRLPIRSAQGAAPTGRDSGPTPTRDRGRDPAPDARRASGRDGASGRPPARAEGFALYVEGPRDRSLLEAWALGVSPPLARALGPVTVILGGCQPVRAADHFRSLRDRAAAHRALCVLDPDVERRPPPPAAREPGLEFFTWGRRHIESYLLVPSAIRRSLRLAHDDTRLERYFRAALPAPDDEEALRELDAKPLFSEHGDFQQLLGRPVRPAQVARAMQPHELHADVHALFGMLRQALGILEPAALRRVPRAPS